MAVYIVNSYDINDFETFKSYPGQVGPLLAKYGAKVLAMETNPRAIEGKAKTMNVIIQFPSEEVVDTFYNDPEYQKIIDLRLKSSSNCTIILLNEFERK